MKKILYLLLMLVMLWVGGIYRIDGLLALGIAELLLWICLAWISWRRRKHLKLGFEKQLATAPRQKKVPCTLRGENTGKGAVPRFRARLQYCYPWESKNKKLYVFGSLRGGEVQLSRVELPVKYCGLLLLELDKIRVYDWFGLTSSSSRKQGAQGTLAVLGRHREEPGSLSALLSVRREGVPAVVQQVDLDPEASGSRTPSVLGTHRAVGNVVVVDPDGAPGPAAAAPDAGSAVMRQDACTVQISALAEDAPTLRDRLDHGMDLLGPPWAADAPRGWTAVPR